jgi:hypothetical protein
MSTEFKGELTRTQVGFLADGSLEVIEIDAELEAALTQSEDEDKDQPLTPGAWLLLAARDKDLLLDVIAAYHPQRMRSAQPRRKSRLQVTAVAAQAACDVVCSVIAHDLTKADPVTRFTAALVGGDVSGVYAVLSETWFGIPESTDCWGIPGFQEMVALLEDPPDLS